MFSIIGYILLLIVTYSCSQSFDQSDANLKVPELLTKYNYSYEKHEVSTTNDFELSLHRILCKRKVPGNGSCPVVFLMHGMMGSAANWILNGPDASLGYLLADAGFDVWMGNYRGTTYSRKIINFSNVNSIPILSNFFNKIIHRFSLFDNPWDYDISTLAIDDTSRMISYILNETKKNSLSYVCHSLSCVTYLIMISETNFDEEVIDNYIALAPLISLKYTRVQPYEDHLYKLGASILQPLPKFNLGGILKFSTETICEHIMAFCRFFFEQFTVNFPDDLVAVILGHFPQGMSSKVFIHWAQWLYQDNLKPYRYKKSLRPLVPYNLGKSTVKKHIFYGKYDTMVYPENVEFALTKLKNVRSKTKLDYSHYSFLHDVDIRELNEDIIDLLR